MRAMRDSLPEAVDSAKNTREADFGVHRPRDAAQRFEVLGTRIDAVQIPDVIAQMERWIFERGSPRYIAVTGMHGVTEAESNSGFRRVLEEAALVVPDGMPLVWLGRRQGFHLARRVYGPELLEEFCRATVSRGYRHFFYGGASGVAGQLAAKLQDQFPGMRIAGTYSPPFRMLTAEEDQSIAEHVNASQADVLWVGLSTPKQERWMHAYRKKLNVPVLVGVGAAFDFHTGRVAQAPYWMREHGMEWLFRLLQEPQRLWRRYLFGGSRFVFLVLLEFAGLKRYRRPPRVADQPARKVQ
jgi:N-acetylglucosaminyldiphosphoundecaprenol N-acetyl-beta-D-mannosaminyltransferase